MTISNSRLRLGAAAFAAVLLAACGGSKDEADTKPADTGTTIESSESTGSMEASSSDADTSTDADTSADTGTSSDGVETAAVPAEAKALVDMCVAEGETEEVCGCQINVVRDTLGDDDFAKLVDFADQEDEAGAEAFLADIMSEKPDSAMKMGAGVMGCVQG